MADWRRISILIPILLCFFLPRLAVVRRAVTVDEARWLLRSGNVYQAITTRNLAATYQHEHPGVTITYIGALGYLWRFPDYAQEAGGQLPGPSSLENLFKEQGQSPLLILSAGRILVILALGLVLGLVGLYAASLLGWWGAGLGLALIALDPFSLSLTYLLQPDGLSAMLMLLALLAFTRYCLKERGRLDLLISGAAGGLAVLSKSPAAFLLPFLGLLCLFGLASSSPVGLASDRWKVSIRTLLIWGGIACLTFILLWPAMWVGPISTLQKVFGGAFAYASEGNLNSSFFNGQIYPSGSSIRAFYPVAMLWRTTPVMLGGLLLTGWLLISNYRSRDSERSARLVAGILVLYSGLYILAISLSSQKYDRYLLPAWLALLMLAGWGWAGFVERLGRVVSRNGRDNLQLASSTLISLILLGLLIVGVVGAYPYYYTYYNPWLGGLERAARVLMIGWGEELDQAGMFLDKQPKAAGLRVMSWYGDGCFSYFFRGRTVGMDSSTSLAQVKQMDYVVVYYQQYQRQEPNQEILEYLGNLTPVKVIRVDGLDLVKIYQPQ